MALLRSAGRWLSNRVRALVGFQDLLGRLDELRARQDETSVRMDRFEASVAGLDDRLAKAHTDLSEILSAHGAWLHHMREMQAHLMEREADVQERLIQVVRNQDRLTARDGPLSSMLAAEVDRLDGYLAHHAAALLDRLGTAHADQAASGGLKHTYAAQGLDAIIIAPDYDLVVPTEEAGLLIYLLRHGLDAVEPGVRAVLQNRLRPGATAVDIGANVGIHTLAMATAVGAIGRVVSFEPLPHLTAALRRTVQLNGFGERADVRQIAVADTAGEAALHRAAHGPMSSLYPLPGHMGPQPIQVRTEALDDCLVPGTRVDLVKIDVEGAEPGVWRGMQRILRDNHDIEIVMEWSASHFRRSGEDPAGFMAQIRAAGFSPFIIADQPAGGLMPPGDPATIEACNLLLTRRGNSADA